MFAAILGSLVMGTLASKVGENIVGKRLGMSEKDRKLLGTVFGMAGGAYGGYAGQAGFGSTAGSAFTAPGGQSAGMAGASPKVGGDYGTAMNLFNQPQPQTFTGFNQPMSAAYNSPQTFTGVDAPFSSMASGNGYAGTPYQPIDTYSSQVGSADMPPVYEYNQMAGMPVETYGMDMYANNSYGNSNDMFSIGRPDNTWVNPNTPSIKPDNWFDMIEVPKPTYQGPFSGNVSAETFALDTPSRTINVAPSGTPLEVIDASAYTSPPEPFYGVDPNSPTASGSNLGMESVYNSGGNPDIELVPSTGDGYLISPDDQVRLIQANPDGTFTEIGAPSDLSTPQGVEEFINMDQIRADEMMGGPLDPFGTGPNITADRRAATEIFNPYTDGPPDTAKLAQERFRRTGPRLEDLDVATLNTPTARLESLDNKVFNNDIISTDKTPLVSEAVKNAQAKLSGSTGPRLEDFDNIAAAMKYEIPPNDLQKLLSKIPDAVKQWAAETGVALLDMWIKQSLFGQDYDDQIASAGGGGGGVLRGSSPVVSPYSGGGSGGGGKGVLFSMGGSGQQGRGTHIMALQ